MAHNPSLLVRESTKGALKWLYVSPAFSIGGAAWQGAAAKLELAMDGVDSRFYDEERLTRWQDAPAFILAAQNEDGEESYSNFIGRDTIDTLVAGSLEGPLSGFWMAPTFSVFQVMSSKSPSQLNGFERGLSRIQKGFFKEGSAASHFYRDVFYMPGLITGSSTVIDYVGNRGKYSLASFGNLSEGQTVVGDFETEVLGYASFLTIPAYAPLGSGKSDAADKTSGGERRLAQEKGADVADTSARGIQAEEIIVRSMAEADVIEGKWMESNGGSLDALPGHLQQRVAQLRNRANQVAMATLYRAGEYRPESPVRLGLGYLGSGRPRAPGEKTAQTEASSFCAGNINAGASCQRVSLSSS